MKQFFIYILVAFFLTSCVAKKSGNSNLPLKEFEPCDCIANWRWLKETFEKNDAGFQWAIEKKGLESYQQFSDSIENEIKKAKDIYECQQIMNSWGQFFRKGHFYIGANQVARTESVPVDTEKVDYSIETVKSQAQSLKDTLIGVWHSHPYKIGIVKDTINSSRKYVGFIIESRVEEWNEGEVKVEFFEIDNKLSANFYMLDHSLEKRDVRLKGDAKLFIGNMRFLNTMKIDTLEQQLLATSKPLFFKLSDETVLLRVPSFVTSHREAINSLIRNNEKIILSHKNLIIDLRGNGGGSDANWRGIIPFLYTNPIETVGMEFYSTALNREHFLSIPLLGRLIYSKYIRNLKRNDGQFVVRDSVSITKLKTVHPKPEKVIVLVDESCGSSTEQFILAAQQSSKTTIYGKQTFGALDASNMVSVYTPDNLFFMGYCVTRTLRAPENRIDDIGIEPDIIIPDSIPKYKWIDFVINDINQTK